MSEYIPRNVNIKVSIFVRCFVNLVVAEPPVRAEVRHGPTEYFEAGKEINCA